MQYFKVTDNASNAIIDTTKINYSLTLTNRSFYYPFLDFITTSSYTLNLPLDFYFSVSNNLAIHGESYVYNLPKPKNGYFSIIDITTNVNHKGYEISALQLAEVISKFMSLRMDFFVEGFYLWEFLLEKVRLNKFKDLPSRLNSFFLFENIEDCNHLK